MSRFELILLCLCMGACSLGARYDPIAAAGLTGSGFQLIETSRQFHAQVVGQKLSGAGFRAEIEPGGGLNAIYRGESFDGRWSFADGIYCQSLAPSLSGPSYGCYYIAINDRDIRLLPVPPGR